MAGLAKVLAGASDSGPEVPEGMSRRPSGVERDTLCEGSIYLHDQYSSQIWWPMHHVLALEGIYGIWK